MSRRIVVTLVAALLGVLIGIFWARREKASSSPRAASHSTVAPVVESRPTAAAPGAVGSGPRAIPKGPVEARITLADDLNARDGTIRHDLELINEIMVAWRTNFPHYGNPVGENEEITRALSGGNSLELALIPRDHPAVNPEGELCDRWGTPFRFHQLSGDRMEIRSAGEDRKFGTADDALFTPP